MDSRLGYGKEIVTVVWEKRLARVMTRKLCDWKAGWGMGKKA